MKFRRQLQRLPAIAGVGGAGRRHQAASPPKPDLSKVTARKNLNETAFFFPQLTSDSNGVVRMTFTMPEALTKWRFLGFAHDQSVRSGLLEDHAVTAKDIMVQPNPPRFLREGDTVEFTVKVSNQTDKPSAARCGSPLPRRSTASPPTSCSATRSRTRTSTSRPRNRAACAWRIHVPDGCGFLTYKAVAAAANVSDGEEGGLPVLSAASWSPSRCRCRFAARRRRSSSSPSCSSPAARKPSRTRASIVEMVSNPAWYAVLALPYLMEYPYECSEQTFNRLYANALARHIANQRPEDPPHLRPMEKHPRARQPLEKNQDLKAVMIEETPWLRQADNESQARSNVGILFDDNRLNYEMEATLRKLTEMQLGDGSWPWFPGGPRQRLHHALYHHRLRPPAALGRGHQCGPRPPLAPAAGCLDDRRI